jgi:hypothetical protein
LTETFEGSATKSIWGDVWVVIDGEPFPDNCWNDLAVAFFVEYVKAIREISLAVVESAKVWFFDGPYVLRLQRTSPGQIEVRGEGRSRSASAVVDPSAVWTEAEAVGWAIVDACRKKGWDENKDVLRLVNLLTAYCDGCCGPPTAD